MVASPLGRRAARLLLALCLLTVVDSFYYVPTMKASGKASAALSAVLRLPPLPQKGAMMLTALPTIFRRFRPGFMPANKPRGGRRVGKRGLVAQAVTSAFSDKTMRSVVQEVEEEAMQGHPDVIPVLIRYTAGQCSRALYNGCVKCLREGFPNVSIRKMILANSSSNKKQAIFEILVGDQVVSSKQREANGIYLPMQDLQQAIERASQHRKEQVWGKFLDDQGNLKAE